MGGLERRIKNLEAALVGDECPECGYDPHAPYEIVFTGEDEPKEPEFCHGCGRDTHIVITWGMRPTNGNT